jgi:hypothetical protein
VESVVTALCNIMKMNQGQIAELRRKRGMTAEKSDKKGFLGGFFRR